MNVNQIIRMVMRLGGSLLRQSTRGHANETPQERERRRRTQQKLRLGERILRMFGRF